jgi:nickel/cobalt exporter
MPDIADIIRASATHAWLYLPIAVVLGALHALEPGHAKSLMAAYIVAIRGTARQAVILALSAAFGHTIVVWLLVIAAFLIGEKYIVEQAEPWLVLFSGILVVLLALRLFWSVSRKHSHDHHHGHDHNHDHGHGHSHAIPKTHSRGLVGGLEIAWFGFTGGLLPCPAAIAVLLICIQIKAFALGVAMVAAFSLGLALTLVLIGVGVAWGANKAAAKWPALDRVAARLPYLSGALVLTVGIVMTISGLNATGIVGGHK